MSAGEYSPLSWQESTTVESAIAAGELEPQPVTIHALLLAADVLGAFEGDDDEQRQQLADVIGFLQGRAEDLVRRRDRRRLVAEAKRAYAAEHGVPVSQVRLRR
jgi:hypothetical protein